MTMYIIFTSKEINLHKTYYKNENRSQKTHHAYGKEEMLAKVKELQNAGEKVTCVKTAMGSWVNI